MATFLVALQVLNMAFFVQDFQPLTSSSSSISDHNVINTIVEYVSEVVLEKVNAMPENNNKENKDLQLHKHMTVKLVELRQQNFVISPVGIRTKQNSPIPDTYCYHFFKEINPPPPKA